MNDAIESLAKELQESNPDLSLIEARSWVELLWEDFEATRAKAGRKYEGAETTLRIVRHWIQQYGTHLNEFAERYPKYKKLIYNNEDKPLH
ncbi:WVELL protein [Gracilibacillus ureilyticus]|uniref:WVELL protein n=1 Tax=Gracilibacillus ureilyticus TaxID=531814 RepID=A0A1H9QDH8_9BACI|nr:YfhJ family protein [Gracilibacillus ureilyticus]SER58470.1 WVELL protein [Gracilibacillus ureilyticus]